jgi:hypothetical protein
VRVPGYSAEGGSEKPRLTQINVCGEGARGLTPHGPCMTECTPSRPDNAPSAIFPTSRASLDGGSVGDMHQQGPHKEKRYMPARL